MAKLICNKCKRTFRAKKDTILCDSCKIEEYMIGIREAKEKKQQQK